MTDDQREIRRKLRVLEHAESSGDVSKTCRYFGAGILGSGEPVFIDGDKPVRPAAKPGWSIRDRCRTTTPTRHHRRSRRRFFTCAASTTSAPCVLLERYPGIRISDAGVYRILCRNDLNRLARGTRSATTSRFPATIFRWTSSF